MMNFHPIRFIALLVVSLTLVVLAGCRRGTPTDSDPPVIGVSLLNLSNEFIVLLDEAMRTRADELGVRLIVSDAQRSAERQVAQVERFVAQGVDAIILNPCEVDASSPAVEIAIAAGIPVININSETRATPTAFVGSRDEDAGRIAMRFIAEQLDGRGNVVMMHGFMGQAAQLKRDQGAREIIESHPNLTLIAHQTAEWDRAKGMALMENWIQSHGRNLHAVFAQNDEMGMGAVIALEQAGINDDVVVASVDAIADALRAVQDGRLDATVFQDALGQGSTAVETAVKIIRGEAFEPEVFIPFRLVTRENVGEFLD